MTAAGSTPQLSVYGYTPGAGGSAKPSETCARLPRPASGRDRPVTRAGSPGIVSPQTAGFHSHSRFPIVLQTSRVANLTLEGELKKLPSDFAIARTAGLHGRPYTAAVLVIPISSSPGMSRIQSIWRREPRASNPLPSRAFQSLDRSWSPDARSILSRRP